MMKSVISHRPVSRGWSKVFLVLFLLFTAAFLFGSCRKEGGITPVMPSDTQSTAPEEDTALPGEDDGAETPSGGEEAEVVPETNPEDPMKDFVPVVRLAVCSDTHINNSTNDVLAQRLGLLFDTAYRYADAHPTYNPLDAVLMAGDITNTGNADQFRALKSVIKAHIRPETEVFTTMGNHEYFGGGQAEYLRSMSDSLDVHAVVKGFHIIGISPRDGNSYPGDVIRWLQQELQEAAEDAPGMPIFTFQHHHIKDTVYVSRSWYTADSAALKKAYAKYPQVINFSGHSHGPVNNPLSIWQDGFTMLGTGTLNYFEMEVGMTGGTLPPGKENAAQYYIVEADAEGRVRILPYNILTDDFFKTASNTDDPEKQLIYVIDMPSDPSTYLYTSARGNDAAAPYFAPDAQLAIGEITDNSALVTVPQAFDDACIYSYRLVAEEEGGSRREIKFFSEYYFEPMPETVSCRLSGLLDGTKYTVRVYPVNAWGKEGEPITAEFETDTFEDIPYVSAHPVRFEGTFTDFESQTNLRRSSHNGVFSGTADGDWFGGEWNGPESIEDARVELAEGKGYEGSTAAAVSMNGSSHANRAIWLYANEENGLTTAYPRFRYLRVWVDFTGIDFRKASFGLVTMQNELYTTDDFDSRSDLAFYCLAEGETEWKTMYHGADDGCFGAAQASSVKDFKGWLAFPTMDFGARKGTGEGFSAHEVKGVYMYFDYSSDSMLGTPFYLDEIALVEDYTVFTEYGG